MIVVVSCSHYPDDERIYQKQICSLIKHGERVLYITRSNSNINLSTKRLTHINLSLKFSVKKFIVKVEN